MNHPKSNPITYTKPKPTTSHINQHKQWRTFHAREERHLEHRRREEKGGEERGEKCEGFIQEWVEDWQGEGTTICRYPPTTGGLSWIAAVYVEGNTQSSL